MQENLKISIIVPVYNVEPYITRCLQSVMHQTYAGPMECILVDDCGRDNSVVIAEKHISDYNGPISFSIYHHEHNRGLSAARNTGTDNATGDYIFYLDSDDELPIDAVEKLVGKVHEYPGIDMVQGRIVSIPDNPFYDTTCFKEHSYVADNLWIRHAYYRIDDKTIPVNGCNKLLRTEFLKENALYFKEGYIHEDEHWMWFLVKELSSMAFVFTPTYIRYYVPNSIMTSMTEEKDAIYVGEILQDWIQNCDDISWKEQLKKILYFYRKYNVNKYEAKHDIMFANRVFKVLFRYNQYISALYLIIWRTIKPFRDSSKLYRRISENLK